ncbi:hypothetical protein Droror1_Dr00015591 [Drosera rotundifolia]
MQNIFLILSDDLIVQTPLLWLVGSDVIVVDPPRKGLDESVILALQSTVPLKHHHAAVSNSIVSSNKDEKRAWILRAREASIHVKSKTVFEESHSFPQTLIYISCGWDSFKEDCKALLSTKAWYLDKAHGFNFFPGTQSPLAQHRDLGGIQKGCESIGQVKQVCQEEEEEETVVKVDAMETQVLPVKHAAASFHVVESSSLCDCIINGNLSYLKYAAGKGFAEDDISGVKYCQAVGVLTRETLS